MVANENNVFEECEGGAFGTTLESGGTYFRVIFLINPYDTLPTVFLPHRTP